MSLISSSYDQYKYFTNPITEVALRHSFCCAIVYFVADYHYLSL